MNRYGKRNSILIIAPVLPSFRSTGVSPATNVIVEIRVRVNYRQKKGGEAVSLVKTKHPNFAPRKLNTWEHGLQKNFFSKVHFASPTSAPFIYFAAIVHQSSRVCDDFESIERVLVEALVIA